jgi:hypothetical protein
MERPKVNDKKYELLNGDFNSELYEQDKSEYIDYLENRVGVPEEADMPKLIDSLFDLGVLSYKANSEDRVDEMKNRASMLINEFIRQTTAVPEEADMTKELLSDIISWEKDLSEYGSLEGILRERYKIFKRI